MPADAGSSGWRGSLGEASVGLDQRQPDRLALVARAGVTPTSAATWSEALRGLGELHPLMDAGVELVGRDVLRRDGPGVGPVARQALGKCEVLADPGVGALGASGGLEHRERIVGRPASAIARP